jgi:PqqD family protein of HPr-rel-A system
MTKKWRGQREFNLLWRSWDDDEYVVFHTGSGDTHLLNAVAAEALSELERRAVDEGELAQHLADCLARPLDDELKKSAAGMLREFDELGLIEPAP